MDLVDARSRKAGQYSGGMRRRLCVAVAFIGASDVVLLDEPVIICFERKKSIGTKLIVFVFLLKKQKKECFT